MKHKTKHRHTFPPVIWVVAGACVSVLLIIILIQTQNTGSAPNKPPLSNALLSIEEKSWDFGSINMADGVVSHEFMVTNPTSESITINKIYTSCMCTTAEVMDSKNTSLGKFGMPGHGASVPDTNIPVQAGETIKVVARFDPAAHGPSGVGLASRSIYLETNSTQTPKLELKFQAMVTR